MSDSVTIYSSGVVTFTGDFSYEAVLEAGGDDKIVVTSGGVVAETSMGAGTLVVAESGAVISGINVNEEGAVFSGTGVVCTGAEKWYGPAICATFGSMVLAGGEFTNNVAFTDNNYLGQGGALEGYEGSISISGGIYTSNSATGGGGAILAIGGVTEIAGATFSGNRATYGGAFEVSQQGTAVVTEAVFDENSAGYGGAVEIHQGASARLENATFQTNSATSGGAVMVDTYALSKSYLTIEGGFFGGNRAEAGGAILNDGELAVSGGEFTGNQADSGAVICNTGSAVVTSGSFVKNVAIYGGVAWQGNKSLTLNDNDIIGNTAIYGGALYAAGSGSTVISGGAVNYNQAPYNADYELGGMGGALYVTAAATVTVTDVEFSGNFAEVNPDNEWDGGCGGAVINYGNFTVSGGEFTANSAYYGAGLYNQAGAGVPMTVTDVDFANNSATYGGGAICNCWGELVVSGGEFTGNTVEIRDGGAIANWSEAAITDAIFSENTAVKGGALAHTGTTLTVTDASFEGNEAEDGGAFWNMNEWGDSVAEFVNCSFTTNTAEQGGAIWNGETLTVTDSLFSRNEAEDGEGGALYTTASATVEDTEFFGNSALMGGAIYQSEGGLELEADSFLINNAIYGGAIYAAGSGATVVSGGEFTGNSASYDEDYDLGGMGGAIYVANAATVTVADAVFENNFAEVNPDNEWDGGCGGAVINYGSFTVAGGEFTGNSAYYGGALYNQAGAGVPMTVTDADFANNSATYGGGAICNCWGELVVSGGEFTGNTVELSDGGAIANWSVAEITGATFSENTAVKGGAISNSWAESITITDCTFDGNTAEQGGAIWNNAAVILERCEFLTATDTIWNEGTITVTGTTTFNGAVENADAGVFTVELAEAEAQELVRNWSFISGGDIRLDVVSDPADGVYRVATGVGEWSGDISLTVGAFEADTAFTVEAGAITVDRVVAGKYTCTLANEDDTLLLSFGLAPYYVGDVVLTVNRDEVSVSWEPAQDPEGADIGTYRIQLAADADFAGIVAEQTVEATSCIFNVETGSYYLRVSADDAAGIWSAVQTFDVDATPPEKPAASADITDMTNQNVTVTATFSDDSAVKEYSLDGEAWLEYTEGVVMTENGTVFFRAADEAGNLSEVAEYKVENIDRIAPDAPVAAADITTVTNKDVTVAATFSDDSAVKEYSLDGEAWLAYTAAVVMTENGTVFFRAADEAGNLSAVAEYTVANIDRNVPSVAADTTAPTNQSVTVTATFSSDAAKKQYSTDNTHWKNYTKPLTTKKNGTYYFRAVDKNGKASTVVTYEVANIDKTAPDAPTVTTSTTAPTNTGVTLTATFAADVDKKQYSTDKKTWLDYTEAVSAESNGKYYFRGIDAAGNVSKTTTFKVANIDKAAPAIPKVKSSTLKATNRSVTLTAKFSKDSAAKEYSTDNETWSSYTTAVTAEENGTYYFRGIDAAGNVSEVAKFTVENIDKVAPDAPTVTADTNAAKKLVTLTATFPSDAAKKQYSTDGTNWKSCKKAVTAKANGTYYFRGIDAAGNASAVASVTVANLAPTADNSWDAAAVLAGTVYGALDPATDSVDYYQIGDLGGLLLDMASGNAEVTFCDGSKNAVAVKVRCADSSEKELSSMTLVAGDEVSDNIAIGELDDVVRYLKIESTASGSAGYRLAALA